MDIKKYANDIFVTYPILAEIIKHIYGLFQAKFRAGVIGIIQNQNGEILLVKHVFHPDHPWGLPGGWIERNEAPEEALIREVNEETGLTIEVLEPIAIRGTDPRGHIDIAYRCKLKSGKITRLSFELTDYQWVSVEEIPPLQEFHQCAVKQFAKSFGSW